jgi:hypothetical protein
MKKIFCSLMYCFCGLIALAQPAEVRKAVTEIKYKYLELAEFPDYQRKQALIWETDREDGKKYLKAEVIGQYKNNKLCIIKESTKIPKGRMMREFYLYKGELIFLYEKAEAVENYTDENGQARKRMQVIYQNSFYLKKGKIVQQKPKGEYTPYPEQPTEADLAKLFLRMSVDYSKALQKEVFTTKK